VTCTLSTLEVASRADYPHCRSDRLRRSDAHPLRFARWRTRVELGDATSIRGASP
jgi:hypothetical protein